MTVIITDESRRAMIKLLKVSEILKECENSIFDVENAQNIVAQIRIILYE